MNTTSTSSTPLPERWALFYLSALLTTALTTWVGITFGFQGRALAWQWPQLFIDTGISSFVTMAIYVLLTSPAALIVLVSLYPARRYVFGTHLRFPRIVILVFVAMAAPFLGILSLDYNPRIVEDLHKTLSFCLTAALCYTLLLWLLFALLKRLFPATPPQPIPEIFD